MTEQHFAIFDSAIGPCGIVWGQAALPLPNCLWEVKRRRATVYFNATPT